MGCDDVASVHYHEIAMMMIDMMKRWLHTIITLLYYYIFFIYLIIVEEE